MDNEPSGSFILPSLDRHATVTFFYDIRSPSHPPPGFGASASKPFRDSAAIVHRSLANRRECLSSGKQMGIAHLNHIEEAWHWSDNPASKLLDETQWERVSSTAGFTRRESEVCYLLFLGLNRSEIGDKLGLKFSTIRQYVEQIHTKLRVKSRVALVLRIIQIRDYLESVATPDERNEGSQPIQSPIRTNAQNRNDG